MLFSEQAALNYFFEEYKNIIEDWINIVQDVQRMQFYYFDQEISTELTINVSSQQFPAQAHRGGGDGP
jgi:hypothetical protein